MRVNVYSQELLLGNSLPLPATELVVQEAGTGIQYSAVRHFLDSTERLHQTPEDDDRSAITYWLPKSSIRRERLALQFEELAQLVRAAPPSTGLD